MAPATNILQPTPTAASQNQSATIGNGSVIWRCEAAVTAYLAQVNPINPDDFDRLQGWPELKPYWRTGKLMQFTGTATGPGTNSRLGFIFVQSYAHDAAMNAFKARAEEIRKITYPNFELHDVHLYERCIDQSTGFVGWGSDWPPVAYDERFNQP